MINKKDVFEIVYKALQLELDILRYIKPIEQSSLSLIGDKE